MVSRKKSTRSGRRTAQSSCHRRTASFAKKFVLFAIPALAIAVGIAVACAYLLTPERLVTSKLDTLIANYYENDFYPSVLSSSHFSGDIEGTFSNYAERGFPTLTLRQLLASDQAGLTPADADYLRTYCDESTTTVKIHPAPPYRQTDYHVDYHYSCNF